MVKSSKNDYVLPKSGMSPVLSKLSNKIYLHVLVMP